ncbi:MAG: glycine cleavage system protein T [Gemmatales bacterium]|nr:MAG: glycine cleavage system protein T [Gemmatales bacterium]
MSDAEYEGARQKAALFDLSSRGTIEVSGPDATSFLQNLTTNDIAALEIDAGCEAYLATAKAKLIASLWVYRMAETVFHLDVAPGANDRVLKHLNFYLISEQVELADRSAEFACLHVAGPKALEWVKTIFALQEDLAEGRQVVVEDGVVLRPCRRTALPGVDVVAPAAKKEATTSRLHEAGIVKAGAETFDVLRIEGGIPAEGIDMTTDNLVMELGGCERAICYTKGCYLGQEPIVRARDLGHVNWLFRGIAMDTRESPGGGAKVFDREKEVGRLTSSAWSPRFQKMLALGYLRRGHHEAGKSVIIDSGSQRLPGIVADLPFDRETAR